MRRRMFLTLASGLLVPWEPERVYSFSSGLVRPRVVGLHARLKLLIPDGSISNKFSPPLHYPVSKSFFS